MATRLYLPSGAGGTCAAPITPAFDAAWDDTEDADRLKLMAVKELIGFGTKFSDEASTTSGLDVLTRQYVSDPLTTGTIFTVLNTVKGQIRAKESSAGANAAMQLLVRVLSNDGSVVRATLLGHQGGVAPGSNEELDTQLTNIEFPRVAPANLTGAYITVAGDRLVVEIGVREFNTSGTNFTFEMDFGHQVDIADLPEDFTTLTRLVPWIEFSNDFTFGDEEAEVTQEGWGAVT